MNSYKCVKCGRECFFCLHGRKEITEQLCAECYIGAHSQTEPFNSVRQKDIPYDVRKVSPKEVPSITDLIRDEASRRALRNECNGIYKRSADVEVPACAICAQHLDGSRSLKTATGQLICESCHYKLYHEESEFRRFISEAVYNLMLAFDAYKKEKPE